MKSPLLSLLCVAAIAASAFADDAQPKEPLVLQLPAPTVKGTPVDLPSGPNIEPYSDKAPAPFLAPKGVKNVALGKPVTASIAPFTGDLNQITDGKKEAGDEDTVEMKKG